MPSALSGVKRKRRTDGPNHPDRKKKSKPRFKRVKSSAYHSSSEDDAEGEFASGANSTNVRVRLPKDEVEKKKAENGRKSVSADVAGEESGDTQSSGDDGLEQDEEDGRGVQLPNLQDDEDEADQVEMADAPSDEDDEDGSGSDQKDGEEGVRNGGQKRQVKKRNDPAAFAASMSAILSSKLTSTKRADPVLARSAAAASNAEQRADMKLEAKAKRKLTHDKKALQDRGHVRDVMGVESSEVSAAAVAEQEKRLRKMAQRGVVKLFNAVRAAQVRGEEARGVMHNMPGDVVGIDRRTERVNEMSKQGFLDLLAKGS